MLALAKEHKVDFAVLTDRSGACGTQVISIGCRFEEPVLHPPTMPRVFGVRLSWSLRRRLEQTEHDIVPNISKPSSASTTKVNVY